MTSNIPDSEANVFILNSLHIKSCITQTTIRSNTSPSINNLKNTDGVLTNGWNGGDNFPQLELIQDGSLTGCIETHHQYCKIV